MGSVRHRAQHWHDIEPKGILKNPTDFYKNHGYRMKGCWLNQYNENTISMRPRKFYISE